MANLNEAYRRVREQTESNYAARDEGYGVFQGAFQDILGELNNDLDKDNIDKPLSPIGSALDSVLGFREKHIKDAAENTARLEQAQYNARAPLRAQGAADTLKNSLVVKAAENAYNATNTLDGILSDMNIRGDGEDPTSFIRDSVKKYSPLSVSILAAYNRKDLFQVFQPGYTPTVADGTLLHTADDGTTLYATGNNIAKNINRNITRLSKNFRSNLDESDPELSRLLRDPSIKSRTQLFKREDFRDAVNISLKEVPPEMLASHEIYTKQLTSTFKEINTKLSDQTNIFINRARILKDTAVAIEKDNQIRGDSSIGQDEIDKRRRENNEAIIKNAEKIHQLQVNKKYQMNIQSKVLRMAYSQSLITGRPSTVESATQNIDKALYIIAHDPKVREQSAALRAYYGNPQQPPSTAPAAPAAPLPGTTGLPVTGPARVLKAVRKSLIQDKNN